MIYYLGIQHISFLSVMTSFDLVWALIVQCAQHWVIVSPHSGHQEISCRRWGWGHVIHSGGLGSYNSWSGSCRHKEIAQSLGNGRGRKKRVGEGVEGEGGGNRGRQFRKQGRSQDFSRGGSVCRNFANHTHFLKTMPIYL